MCQLSNKLLLSYLTSYIETVSTKVIIETDEFRRAVSACKTETDIQNLIYNLDIEDFLKQIVENFGLLHHRHETALLQYGVMLKGFHNSDVDIDLDLVKASTSSEDWYSIIKGILNILEFQFLFSITEDHLKDIAQTEKSSGLIGKALKDRPDFIDHLVKDFDLSRDFLIKYWELFLEIRNCYSHSFGYIQDIDRRRILEKRNNFVKAYDELSISLKVVGEISRNTFFPSDKIIIEKMYIMNDDELNVFRNVIRIVMPELAKWQARELDGLHGK